MVTRVTRMREGNLPVAQTSFVDRRAERAEVKRLLGDGRLVTMTGPGGVGKTRLALQVAGEIKKAFPDGVWFVDLTTLTEERLLSSTVSHSLGIPDSGDLSAEEALTSYLGPRKILLVFDNCEHLISSCAVLADRLIAHCPGLRLLATSREPLRIGGERLLPVGPLAVGEARSATRADAVHLFVERATSAGARLDESAQASVAELCRHLDGLPLAIELAASRMRAFRPTQILERVTDLNHVLGTGSRTAPDRQRSLHGSIEWSYQLCTEEERRLWQYTSVFSGSFDLDAAHAVCGEGTEMQTMDLVASLIDKSILTIVEERGAVRYRLLVALRQFAAAKMISDAERARLRRRHAEWYLAIAENARANWISEEQVRWLDRLRNDHPNLGASLAFLLSSPETVPAALRMASTLHYYWQACGLYEEGRHWLRAALERYPGRDFPRIRALLSLAWLSSFHGSKDARAYLAEARAISTDLTSPDASALVTHASGMEALFSGDTAEAVRLFESTLDDVRSSGHVKQLIETLNALAIAHGINGDAAAAARCHEECLSLTQPRGESWHRSYDLWSLAVATWRGGDEHRATVLARESLELKRVLDDRTGIAWCMELLAWIAASTQPGISARLLGAASALWHLTAPSTLHAVPDLLKLHTECEQNLRAKLGEKDCQRTFDAGRAASYEKSLAWALGTSTRTDEPAVTNTPSPLTRREAEVASLVAEGLTNREIAERLVISPRTAEAHVENILTKLGFTSRAQIATWHTERPSDPFCTSAT